MGSGTGVAPTPLTSSSQCPHRRPIPASTFSTSAPITSLHSPAHLFCPPLLPLLPAHFRPGPSPFGSPPTALPLAFLESCSVQPWRVLWGPSGLESNSGQWVGSQSLGDLIMGILGLQASLVPIGRHVPNPLFSPLPFCLASWEEKACRGPRARYLDWRCPA